jgi:phage protein D
LFEGRITALEARFPSKGTPELIVLAEDALQDLRMTRRTRTFVGKTDAQVFARIADDHQMEKGVDLSGATHQVLAQVNQSDLAFLRDRARAIEAEIWLSVGSSGKPVLHAQRRANRGAGAPIKLGWRNELQDFAVLADLAHQRTAVVASGWSVSAKNKLSYSAGDTDLGTELAGTDSGAAILRSKFAERKEALAHGVPFDQGEAEARAKAYFKMGARRFVVGHGIARTNPKLRVGAVADLDGLGPLFNGKYYLSEVRHRFDSVRGLRTEFCAERPGLGQP